MKKVLTGLLTMGLVLSMGSATAVYAHRHGHGHGCSGSAKSSVCGYCSSGCTYVDADHDGICDNCDRTICYKTGRHKHSKSGRYCR